MTQASVLDHDTPPGDLDRPVMVLVCSGHFMSHFYTLTLPPLFLLLHTELDLSFVALGLLLTVFSAANGLCQIPAGFLVDRFGGPQVVVAGLALESIAFALMGFASGYAVLLTLAVIAGIGNSVFHPADYHIMVARIDPRCHGRAFSVHTFAGHLGTAAAPATILALAALVGWRGSLLAAGLVGLAVMAALASQMSRLSSHNNAGRVSPANKSKPDDQDKPAADPAPKPAGLAFLFSSPMLMMFLFFVATSLTSSGMQTFFIAALGAVQDAPIEAAGIALTAYLFASAIGVLAGGLLADITTRHGRIAVVAFVLTAMVMLALTNISLSAVIVIVLLTLAGFAQGVVRPARDMLVKAATPAGSVGKAFGFTSTGLAVGSTFAPVLFGWFVDSGRPEWVFHIIVWCMIVGIVSVIAGDRSRDAAQPSP